jgi:hypothetical protein
MSGDEYRIVPMNPATNAFMEMEAEGETEWMCMEDTRLGFLMTKFLMRMAALPFFASACSEARIRECLKEDAVVGGVHWIRMPNLRFCSTECCNQFIADHKEELTGEDLLLCDACRTNYAPDGESCVLVFSNLLVIAVCCQACKHVDPATYAHTN